MATSKIQNSLNETLKGRVIVADTSSLLIAGTSLLEHLEESTLVLPVVVVKELEDKRSHPTLGFIARQWLRLIEEYRVTEGRRLRGGVKLEGYKDVLFRVEHNHTNQESLPEHLQNGSHDSTILAVAMNFKSEYLARKAGEIEDGIEQDVILLSNDMPMRLHATLELSQEIETVEFISGEGTKPFQGRFTLDISGDDLESINVYADELDSNLEELVRDNLPDDAASVSFTEILIDGNHTQRAVVIAGEDAYIVGDKASATGTRSKPSGISGRTLEQKVLIELLSTSAEELPIVSVGGGAGTGKTLLTVATALQELKYGHYEKIMVFRSLHELGEGQEMGFLPGSVDEKMGPWAGAVFDAIDTIARVKNPAKRNEGPVALEKRKAEATRLKEMVEIAPITYLRGRSLSNTFMVLEEAQNFSRSEILNILSRAGKGSKIVLTFDALQVDNRFLKSGKDADIWSVIDSLAHTDVFAHITLLKTERSRVAEIASGILANNG